MIETISKIDESVIIFIKNYLVVENISRIMIVFSLLGNLAMVWIIISIYLSITERDKYIFLITSLSLLFVLIFVDIILKGVVNRSRPFDMIESIKILTWISSTSSFPSGHAASSFAAAFVISKFKKKITGYVYILAFIISLSRIYLLLHYPSDVFIGMILGMIFGIIAFYFYKKIKC